MYDSIERGAADECKPLTGRRPRTFTLTHLLVACGAVCVCAIGATTVVNTHLVVNTHEDSALVNFDDDYPEGAQLGARAPRPMTTDRVRATFSDHARCVGELRQRRHQKNVEERLKLNQEIRKLKQKYTETETEIRKLYYIDVEKCSKAEPRSKPSPLPPRPDEYPSETRPEPEEHEEHEEHEHDLVGCEKVCEGHGYDKDTCDGMKGCHFDEHDQQCFSAVGQEDCDHADRYNETHGYEPEEHEPEEPEEPEPEEPEEPEPEEPDLT